ncbi:MAG: type II toxin-antitoxin system PemK/MazF family toxin [Micromonosporaceae bacterium]|nr:type II toxin-antitoxin system PemK/MazF family toxin [Micromonosporaceae bacterium]
MTDRGDVLIADLAPVVGHEQGGRRPVLVLSTAVYHSWPIGMVIAAPITSVRRGLEHHVPIGAESGLHRPSFVMPEFTRAISVQRLARQALGAAPPDVVDAAERWLSYLTSEPVD